jgi:hypothetical protein
LAAGIAEAGWNSDEETTEENRIGTGTGIISGLEMGPDLGEGIAGRSAS